MATSKAMKEWEKKYATQIKGLAEANKVDLGVASSMLQKNLTGGGQYKGGGTISSVQAASELAAAQKAGRAAASPSAKRAAASLGATIPTATVPTADAYYSDQLTSLADAQRKAEEQAAKLRTQQAISSVEGYIPQIQQQTAKQMQEAYIAAQRAKMAAPQTLAAMGYTGGAAESSLMGLDTDYMNRRQALAEAESVSMDQIRQNIADIQATGNVELANLAANYYSNLMQTQREAQAQQMAQQQWEAEMAMRQAEQDENTRRWNLQNVGVGLGAGATTPYTTPISTPASTQAVVTTPSFVAKYANPQDLMAAEIDAAKQIGTNRSRDNIINIIQRMTVSGRISDGIAAILLQRFGVV